MNPIISAVRSSLVTIINRIDNGDCDIATDEADELISVLRKYTDKDKRMSKYQACEYLNISRATFDNYVSNGWIPKGTHQQGFKELSWLQKDLDKFKQSYRK
jgi:predicted DNA-binding transcriptional regulator AlpA